MLMGLGKGLPLARSHVMLGCGRPSASHLSCTESPSFIVFTLVVLPILIAGGTETSILLHQ